MGFRNDYPYTDFHELNLDWVIGEVKRCLADVDALEKDFVELEKYVNDYFKNLDISDEVRKKIDKLVEDGTIEAMVASAVRYNDTFNVSLMGSLPYQRSGAYGSMQGGCYNPDRNEVITSELANDGRAALIKAFNPATGLIRAQSVLQIGHCNSMTYADGYIYATGVLYFDDHLNDIYKINAETLELEETIVKHFGFPNYSMTYIDGYFYLINHYAAQPSPTAEYDPSFNHLDIVKLDTDFNMVARKTYTGNLGRSIVFSGKIGHYLALYNSNPRSFYLLDATMNLANTISLNSVVNGYMYLGEPEFIDGVELDSIYIGYAGNSYSGQGTGWHCIGKTYLTKGFNGGSGATALTYERDITIHVSETNANAAYDRDGSSLKPFSNIWEAMNVIQNSPMFSKITIQLDDTVERDSEYPIYIKGCTCNLEIKGKTGTYTMFTRLHIEDSPSVYLERIGAYAYNESVDGQTRDFNIALINSKLTVRDYPNHKTDNQMIIGVDYRSELSIRSMNNNNSTDFSGSYNDGVVKSRILRECTGVLVLTSLDGVQTYGIGRWHNFIQYFTSGTFPFGQTVYLPKVANGLTLRVSLKKIGFSQDCPLTVDVHESSSCMTTGFVYNSPWSTTDSIAVRVSGSSNTSVSDVVSRSFNLIGSDIQHTSTNIYAR